MSPSESSRRDPLVISGNSLMSGGHSTSFATGSPQSLLRNYLIFVRDMRGQRRAPSIELRTADVAVIASHLGVSSEYVLGGLLDLMGATRAQRSAMMAMLAAGALTLVLTGSFVSDLSTDGVSVEMTRLAEAVQAAATSSDDRAQFERSSAAAVASDAAGTPDAARSVPSQSRLTEAAVSTPRPDVLQSAASATSTAAETDPGTIPQVDATAAEPVSIGVSPDGSLVASVAPPVPAAPTHDEPTATAELPDGTTVGVAVPPVPPAPTDEQVATAQLPDGTTVGVAAPPVPPAPTDEQVATAQLPDGTTVGVAAPPVPPTSGD